MAVELEAHKHTCVLCAPAFVFHHRHAVLCCRPCANHRAQFDRVWDSGRQGREVWVTTAPLVVQAVMIRGTDLCRRAAAAAAWL